MCGAPPPFGALVIFSESLGEALPESLHRHRRHAVLLTELIFFPDVLLDQEGGDHHRAERVLELGGAVRSTLDRWTSKLFDYINRVTRRFL